MQFRKMSFGSATPQLSCCVMIFVYHLSMVVEKRKKYLFFGMPHLNKRGADGLFFLFHIFTHFVEALFGVRRI